MLKIQEIPQKNSKIPIFFMISEKKKKLSNSEISKIF